MVWVLSFDLSNILVVTGGFEDFLDLHDPAYVLEKIRREVYAVISDALLWRTIFEHLTVSEIFGTSTVDIPSFKQCSPVLYSDQLSQGFITSSVSFG